MMDLKHNRQTYDLHSLVRRAEKPVYSGARARFVLQLILLSLAIAALFAFFSMKIVSVQLLPTLEDIGKDTVVRNARLASHMLESQLDQLEVKSDLLAVSLQRVGSRLEEDKLDGILSDAHLRALQVDAMALLGKNGEIAYSRQRNVQNDGYGPLSSQILLQLQSGAEFAVFAAAKSETKGFAVLEPNVAVGLVAKKWRNESGETLGTLLVLHFVSASDLHDISRYTGVTLRLAEPSVRKSDLDTQTTASFRFLENIGKAYTFEITAQGVDGVNPLYLHGEALNDTWQASLVTKNSIFKGLFILSCLMFLLTYLLLDRIFLRPLVQIHQQLDRIVKTGVVIGSFRVNGSRVFRNFATSVETLVDRLMSAEERAAQNAKNSQAKSEFLAGIGKKMHDPIHQIKECSRQFRGIARTETSLACAGKIDAATSALTEAFNNLMDFAMVDSGRVRLDNKPFFLDDALAQLASEYRTVCRDKELEFIFSVPPEIPQNLIGDRRRITQVLRCLLDNACKFTEEGEVLLGCSLENRSGNVVSLRFLVRDTGRGMQPEELATLFEPGAQREEKQHGQIGLGIGLAIARSLVGIMGGEIAVRSVYGRGSSFTFVLQFKLDHSLPVTAVLGNPAMRNMRVLVFEEDQTSRLVCYDMLKGLVLHIETVETAELARNLLRESCHGQHYNVVYIGVSIGFAGNPADAWLRLAGTEQLTYKPIVIVTANSAVPIADELRRGQVDFFLQKPVMSHQLLQAVSDVMARHVSTEKKVREVGFTGTRALVVEDNSINMQLAQELLSALHIEVDTAVTGLEAVRKVRSSQRVPPYDIIFMDILMPEMDGVTATREIRSDERFATIPIIAMTAHVQQESRESYLRAGMNDCLPKPIDSVAMHSLLLRYLAHGPEAGRPDPEHVSDLLENREERPPEPGSFTVTLSRSAQRQQPTQLQKETSMTTPLSTTTDGQNDAVFASLVKNGFDTAGALALLNRNTKLYLSVLGGFYRQYSTSYADLEKAVAELTDLPTLQREVHTIKGLAGTLGHAGLQTKALAFEHACKEPDKHNDSELQQMGREFLVVFRQVLDALKAVVG